MEIGNQELFCTNKDGAPLTTRGDDEGDLSCPTYFVTGIHLGLDSVRMAPGQPAGIMVWTPPLRTASTVPSWKS